jgi:hypothetical protein
MIRNPYSQLAAIKKKMKAIEGEPTTLQFIDGSLLELTDRENADLLHNVMHGIPDKNVSFILDKLERGIEDHEGVCHLLQAFSIDINELWSDEL